MTISLVDNEKGTSAKVFEKTLKEEEVSSMISTLLLEQDLELRVPAVSDLGVAAGEVISSMRSDLDSLLRAMRVEEKDDGRSAIFSITLVSEASLSVSGSFVEDEYEKLNAEELKTEALAHICRMMFKALHDEGVL